MKKIKGFYIAKPCKAKQAMGTHSSVIPFFPMSRNVNSTLGTCTVIAKTNESKIQEDQANSNNYKLRSQWDGGYQEQSAKHLLVLKILLDLGKSYSFLFGNLQESLAPEIVILCQLLLIEFLSVVTLSFGVLMAHRCAIS